MESLNLSLDVPCCRHDMWTYLVLYSVKWKYWIDHCRENEIFVYMPTSLINGMFELFPWCETWYVSLFDFVFGKVEVLGWLCLESNWLCIRKNESTGMSLSRKWDFGLFGFVFDKMKVLECLLSWKRDFSLYGYNFDKYEGWTCPLI